MLEEVRGEGRGEHLLTDPNIITTQPSVDLSMPSFTSTAISSYTNSHLSTLRPKIKTPYLVTSTFL
jgi:hypothetical protein